MNKKTEYKVGYKGKNMCIWCTWSRSKYSNTHLWCTYYHKTCQSIAYSCEGIKVHLLDY